MNKPSPFFPVLGQPFPSRIYLYPLEFHHSSSGILWSAFPSLTLQTSVQRVKWVAALFHLQDISQSFPASHFDLIHIALNSCCSHNFCVILCSHHLRSFEGIAPFKVSVYFLHVLVLFVCHVSAAHYRIDLTFDWYNLISRDRSLTLNGCKMKL